MAFTPITVTGTYAREDGSVEAGSVSLTATAFMTNSSQIRVNAPQVAVLDGTGHFSMTVAATNDPGTQPTGVLYRVDESMVGVTLRTYYISLPYNGGAVDLGSVVPTVPPGSPGWPYALDTSVVHIGGSETVTGDKTFSGHLYVNTPSAASDAAPKSYVDAANVASTAGLTVHASCVAASAGTNQNIAAFSGTTLDGATLTSGTSRILLKDQTTASQNGIWVYQGNGAALTRPSDYASGSQQTRPYVFVTSGATNNNTGWALTGALTITVDTNAAPFAQFLGVGTVTQTYATTIGDGATTTFTIPHNLGTTDIGVDAYLTAVGTNQEVTPDVGTRTLNTCVVTFATAPSNAGVRVVVTGSAAIAANPGAVYATDSAVVHLSGNETINGVKTFAANPVFNASSIPGSAIQSGTFVHVPTAANEQVIYHRLGASASDANDGLTPYTAKLTIGAALSALGGNPGIVNCGYGTVNHTGLTLAAGQTITGVGVGTTLNNTGTGPNITLPALSNKCALRDLSLTGVAGSTHGIHVIDSLWFETHKVSVLSWGNNSAALRLDTVNNPGGNGTYFGSFYDLDINGNSATGSIGIHLTGTAAGANRHRFYSPVLRNCVTAIRNTVSDKLLVVGAEISGNTTGYLVDGVAATNSTFYDPAFEANTTHINISVAAFAQTFVLPTFASPTAFGIDNGVATQIITSDSSIIESKLQAAKFLGRVRVTQFGVLAGVASPIRVSSTPVTVAGTNAETALDTLVVPGNSLAVGDVLEGEVYGVYTTAAGVDVVTIRLNIAGGNVAVAFNSVAGAVTNAPFKIKWRAVVTQAGATGQAEIHGEASINGVYSVFPNTAVSAIGNTSSNQNWNITAQWTNTGTGDSITARQSFVTASNKQ